MKKNMMQIILSDSQIQVLEKIARRSKMDAWFEINGNTVKKADICTLLYNATAYDLETITAKEMTTIIDIVFKACSGRGSIQI